MSVVTELIHGDVIDALAGVADGTFDACLCDPPYGLPGGFMGKEWDSFTGREDVAFGYYIAGLIDGEGCFRVHRHKRGSHTCNFSIHMRRDDRAILDKACREIGIGTVNACDASSDGTRPMVRWAVQNKGDCNRLVGFLRRFPLRAKKRLDFEAWAEAVDEWLGRPRGNRWKGAADQTAAASHKRQIEQAREYTEPAWSGHPYQDWCRTWAKELLRVLRPGGFALCYGGTRTSHRLASALEDAGFEIRDTLMWLYGSG